MSGNPGAGKTTIAKIVEEITGAVRLTSDEVRVELFPKPTFSKQEHDELYAILNQRTEELLKSGQSVIYDANLNRLQHRQEKYDICERVGAKPVLLWVKTPREMARSRAVHDSRSHLWPPNETPGDMFDRVVDIVEEPNDAELYIRVDGQNASKETVITALGM